MSRLESLKELLQENDKDSFLLFAIAKEYESLNLDDKAQAVYQQLYMLDPDYIGLYFHFAKLFERLEDYESALRYYDEGIKKAIILGDQHSLAELKNAKLNLELDL